MKPLRRTNPLFALALLAIIILVPRPVLAESTFADGEYVLPFEVLKGDVDELSATADYMVSPAKAIVKNGQLFAELTLKNASWWQYFRVGTQSGTFIDVLTVSEDTENDTRIVQFEIDDTEKVVDAQIHIIVSGIPGFVYDNQYEIRFRFDYSAIAMTVELPKSEQQGSEAAPQSEDKNEDVDNDDEATPEQITESAVEDEPVSRPQEAEGAKEEQTEEPAIALEETTEVATEPGEAAAPEVEVVEQSTVEFAHDVDSTEASSKSSNFLIVLAVIVILGLLVVLYFLRANKRK